MANLNFADLEDGFVFNSCTQNNMTHSNHLSNETSPYLLQHVKNPVDWYPWGEKALNKAKEENKLILGPEKIRLFSIKAQSDLLPPLSAINLI